MSIDTSLLDGFPFSVPVAYTWLLERGWVGFDEFSGLQPWYFLGKSEIFSVNERWPEGPGPHTLVAFGRRQDNDDIACFLPEGGEVKVALIHGWTATGYDVVETYNSMWDWLKIVIDDIAEWAEPERP